MIQSGRVKRMEAKFMLLVITAICLIIANILKNNIFYLLALFAWLAYLTKPIQDDIKDIKIELKRIKKCHNNKY